MSIIITQIAPNLLRNTLQRISSQFSMFSPAISAVKPAGLFSVPARTVIRVHFPRPNETKRVKRHGFKTRMSTPSGRRVLMNRILKGRWVISH